MGEEQEQGSDEEIIVLQDENSIELQYSEDLNHDELLEAKAYSLLFALGGYTYTNLMEEGVPETANVVEEGKEVANDDGDDGDDYARSCSEVDEEALIRQKSPYEQKFIRAHRSLFSETHNPNRYLHYPPMRIKLK